MTLFINGEEFQNATSTDYSMAWAESRYTISRSRFPRVGRDGVTSNTIDLSLRVAGQNAMQDKERLEGMCEQGHMLLLRSDSQRLWSNFYSIFAVVLGVSFKEESPFYWTATLTVEFAGTPYTHYGIYDVSTKQIANEYELAGVTTVGLPQNTTTVVASDVVPIETRGTERVIHNYEVLDSGTYVENEVMQETFQFKVDPEVAHTNRVKLLDGENVVKGTMHQFSTVWTLQNAQCRLTVVDSLLTYYDNLDNLVEQFAIGAVDWMAVKILVNDDEYVCIMIDDTITIELWRGRDPVIWPGNVEFVYINADAPGSDQTTDPTDNSLTVTGISLRIASNAFFKITTEKRIMPQESGDPHESHESQPRYQLLTDSSVTRNLEVLKRQA